MSEAPTLYSPIRIGEMQLSHRVIMAPLTRTRAGEDGTPTAAHTTYYQQRAGADGASLIITEGVFPAFSHRTFPGQPGIATEEHVAGWRAVADAVHSQGGYIFMQIMHGGRVSHPDLLCGAHPQAPSAIGSGTPVRGFRGKLEESIPEEMTDADIQRVIAEFVDGARRAVAAGLDGVEIHAANGYLLHQFLSPSSNQRTDAYGGSPENRARFSAEIIRAVAAAIGAERTAVRISPEHNIQGVLETDTDDLLATYQELLGSIADLDLAYVSILHANTAGKLVATLRGFCGDTPVVLNSGFGVVTTREAATEIIAAELADAVAVGRPLIANPDLVRRWREGLALNAADPDTFYLGGEHGYIDYPFAD